MSKPTDLFGCDPDFVAAPSDYEMGYAAGIKAASAAVAALVPEGYSPGFIAAGYVAGVRYSVAAIDALKEES